MRLPRGAVLIAWGCCIAIGAITILGLGDVLKQDRLLQAAGNFVQAVVPLLFAIPAALIISRLPRNSIGWLLMAPALLMAAAGLTGEYLASLPAAPEPTLPILLMCLFYASSWLELIFPLLLIGLLFPTGRPLTPGWRWLVYLSAGMIVFFLLWAGVSPVFELDTIPWTLKNPYGFLTEPEVQVIMMAWSILLAALTAASLVSIVIRFRRAAAVEREQMKWMLYACALFALVYIPSVLLGGMPTFKIPLVKDISNLLFGLAIAAIPAAIAIAVLRYHLFDIDVIIRLTLVYILVTGLLGLVYLGGIVLLQGALRALTGTTDAAVVITTLLIAALFNPLRRRIQAVIDRRFFRQKYNAEQALAEFSAAARGGSDVDALTGMLVEIAQKTLQPTQVSLLVKKGEERRLGT